MPPLWMSASLAIAADTATKGEGRDRDEGVCVRGRRCRRKRGDGVRREKGTSSGHRYAFRSRPHRSGRFLGAHLANASVGATVPGREDAALRGVLTSALTVPVMSPPIGCRTLWRGTRPAGSTRSCGWTGPGSAALVRCGPAGGAPRAEAPADGGRARDPAPASQAVGPAPRLRRRPIPRPARRGWCPSPPRSGSAAAT